MKSLFGTVVAVFFCPLHYTVMADDHTVVTPKDLVSVREIGGEQRGMFTISPDGEWIAFQLHTPDVEKGDYKLTWMTLPTSGGQAPKAIADGGDVILNPGKKTAVYNGNRGVVKAQWSPDSKQFAYTMKKDGETQVWLSRPGRKGQRKLTLGPRNVSEFAWSSDGSKIYYTLGLSRQETANVFAEEKRSGFLYDGRFEFAVLSDHFPQLGKYCSPDGENRVIPFHEEYDCSQTLWVHDIAARKNRLATDEEVKAYQPVQAEMLPSHIKGERVVDAVNRWGAADQYAWVENKDPEVYLGGTPPFVIHAHVDGTIYRCAADECSRQRFFHDQKTWWSEDGRELYFTRRDGWNFSEMGVYGWTPLTGDVRPIYREDNGWLQKCEMVQGRLICLHETLTTPPKLISMSLRDGRYETLYDQNPEFSNRQFTKIEKLEWEDKFGSPTHGFLVYPNNYDAQKTYPLVFITYAAKRFLKGGVGDEYPVHPLAAEGFFVLAHDRPLDLEIIEKSANHNEELHKDLYWRWATLSSQEIIIDRLVARGLIDSHRVAITGLSEGAAQVFFAMMHSDKFAAFISSGGEYNSAYYFLANRFGRQRLSSLLNGSPEDQGSYWKDKSIEYNLSRLYGPLLMNVSDSEAPFTAITANYLQEADKPVEMYVFPDAAHIKWRPDQRLAIYRRNIQWLKFWLKGEVDADPVSPGQYERWFSLCEQHVKNVTSSNDSSRGGRDTDHFAFCANREEWRVAN